MSATALEARDISVSLGGRRVLGNVSFAIEKGEFLSIIGPNGAGKTTLIRALNGIVATEAGEVCVMGRALSSYRQRDLAKIVSYVPQADGRHFPFSVFEFVMLGRYPYMSPFSPASVEDRSAAEAALERTGARHLAGRSIGTLSGGERRQVYIAAALAQGASILLLDEPTAFLDYRHRVEVAALLERLNRDEGATIVSVTHDIDEQVLTCSRVVAIKDGAVAFNAAPDGLLVHGVLEGIYDTPFRHVHDPGSSVPVVLPSSARV